MRPEPHLLNGEPLTSLVEQDVKTVRVSMHHGGCGGEFKATGEYQAMAPPNYLHICNKCHGGFWLRGGAKYPTTKLVLL